MYRVGDIVRVVTPQWDAEVGCLMVVFKVDATRVPIAARKLFTGGTYDKTGYWFSTANVKYIGHIDVEGTCTK